MPRLRCVSSRIRHAALAALCALALAGLGACMPLVEDESAAPFGVSANVGAWAWISGSTAAGAVGVYGTQGVANPANVPGGRTGAASWTDRSGNLWLFGGVTAASSGSLLNDLWKFNGTNWTWMSGSSATGAFGVYGAKGTPSPTNVPGGRSGAASWIDGSGNLWLFGGLGNAVSPSSGFLNDLWKFDGTNWTWVSGSSAAGTAGVYGTQGLAAAGNAPGGRGTAVAWIDAGGDLWLFGGTAGGSFLNDLWRFDGTNWTWISGSSTTNAPGVYGTQGVSAPGDVPGSRQNAVGWIDASGSFWLFGGFGPGTGGNGGLNDLWTFNGADWTWIAGSTSATLSAPGVYGTQGVAAPGNTPGARGNAATWVDSAGNLWLFGGGGPTTTPFNDLWKFDGSEWTWVLGSNTAGAAGSYGTQGTASPANFPGARASAMSWITGASLWLFGGNATPSPGTGMNDLWRSAP